MLDPSFARSTQAWLILLKIASYHLRPPSQAPLPLVTRDPEVAEHSTVLLITIRLGILLITSASASIGTSLMGLTIVTHAPPPLKVREGANGPLCRGHPLPTYARTRTLMGTHPRVGSGLLLLLLNFRVRHSRLGLLCRPPRRRPLWSL